MSQMPEQIYECPSCGNKVKARVLEAFCPVRGCDWQRMKAVMSPSPFETDIEPQGGKPMIGCLALLVSGALSLAVIYAIIQEVVK